ncbi:MAG: MBL fold metallo-hydrolase [Sphingobacteriales bacterium]|jgi:glyoxylase-like metal-dependent hydrolase (beta-lactamase superfamily II)|nr:MBL fold metallo-hydrolase [Sphingobacteriales bacterium]NCT75792.1 MBL fold metallo-hydrolase [Chitinophagaceae bacterium]OJW32678.1 MAG: MBL fold metallo-hydrolase [Sphingobacteriales bacterium 46-32]
MKLYSVNTGYFKLDGGAMFGVVPKSMWNKINPADENNMCSWALRSLLIEDGNRLILVDTGMGDKQDAKFFGHYYLHGNDTLDGSLKKHGFTRNDITDVFMTHLHFDHCGGSIKREGDQLVPAFPRAIFWSNAAHWDWAVHPNDREKASFLKENILPIKQSGQLKFIPDAGLVAGSNQLRSASFADGFDIRFVDGHTQSMMLPQLQYKRRTIVYMADLLPSAGHMPLPYVMAYDMFPLTTLGEKKSFLQEAADNDYVLFFEHDPVNECCTVQQTEKGVRPNEFFKLSEL